MTPLEFKNFYSILQSFKDLLYSEGFDINENNVEENTSDETAPVPVESLEDRTFKEIESLRQIENDSLDLIDEKKIDKDHDIDHKSITTISEDNLIEIKSNEGYNLNTDDIFKELDDIVPSIEKGESEQNLEKSLPENIINFEADKKSDELKDSSPKEDNKKKQLDPKEWDPW